MIILRFNINKFFGSGHLFRCLMLYDLINENNSEKILLIKRDNLFFNKFSGLLKFKNFLAFNKSGEEFNIIKKILSKHNSSKKNVIVLDIKDTDLEYVKKLKSIGLKIISIDDLGSGRNSVDLLIDANIHNEKSSRNRLFGEKFILLNPVYSKINSKHKKIRKKIKSAILFFGGSDPAGIADFLISNLKKINFYGWKITLITASEKINSMKPQKNIHVLKPELNSAELAKLYYNSDIAVISGGISLYETMCTGTPSIVINQNSEQLRNSNFYNNCILNAGIFNPDDFVTKLNDFFIKISDYKTRLNLSINSKLKIDGLGYKRIINKIN